MAFAAAGVALALAAVVLAGFVARRRLAHRTPPSIDWTEDDGDEWVLRFVRPYRWPLAVALVLILAVTAVGLAAPWPLKVVVDHAIGGEPLPTQLGVLDGLSSRGLVLVSVAAGLVLVLVGVLLGYLVAYLLGAIEVLIAADMRAAVFHRLQHASVRFHDENRTGDLISRLTSDVGRVRDVVVTWFDTVLPDVLTLLGILGIMIAVDAQLTLVAVSVVPLLLYYGFAKRPRIRAAQRRAQDRRGEMTSHATDVLRNVRVVQMFSRERDEALRFRRQLDRTADAAIESLDVSARYRPISTVVLGLGTAAVTAVGAVKVIDGEMSLGTLLVVLAYLSGLYGPIRSLSRTVSTFAKGAASRDRLVELFADDHAVPEHPDAVAAPEGPLEVALVDVHFGYRPRREVLTGASLTVAPDESVCLVGASGAGKSTLLSLLMRMYDPGVGSVRLGGLDVRTMTIESLRNRITMVPQDPLMMDGTIADNIALGRRDATRDEVEAAAALVGVDLVARELPLGYDTPVGEGGALLSGGQRRRVALARALLRDAPILLLDEPTAGLDATAANEVMDAVATAAEGRTALIVSHDPLVASQVDRIVVLEDGAIAGLGTATTLAPEWAAHAVQEIRTTGVRREEVKRP